MAMDTIYLEANLEGAPVWVHLIPLGELKTRDGRKFTLSNPQNIIREFQLGEIDLPIDYEHQNDKPEAKNSGPVAAAGWITELEIRENGIWGKVSWTDKARELIQNKEYRYLSPSLMITKEQGEIVRLKGAGLVHNPNLYLTALASQEPQSPYEELIAKLSDALGLDTSGDANAVVAATLAMRDAGTSPDPSRYVPVEALQEVLMHRDAELKAATCERVERKVNEAMQGGYLTGAMRGWAVELCQSDEASFDKFISSAVPPYAYFLKPMLPNTPPQTLQDIAPPADVALLSSQLGIDPKRIT